MYNSKEEELVLNGAPDAKNVYIVNMYCTNCEKKQEKEIPLGTTIQERNPICGTCGCRTLVKRKPTDD